MTITEFLEPAPKVQTELASLEVALNQQALGIAEHWRNFANGQERGFLAYFMLENQGHEHIRQLFLEDIKASLEVPYPDEKIVLSCGRAILRSFSRTYDDGKPYDVTYIGELLEPVQ